MKTMITLSVALGLAVAAASSASAQSQATMNANAAQDLQRADRSLNTQYTATMNRLSTPSRTLLRNAQRTWISFRDQQCRFEASGRPGRVRLSDGALDLLGAPDDRADPAVADPGPMPGGRSVLPALRPAWTEREKGRRPQGRLPSFLSGRGRHDQKNRASPLRSG